MDEYDDFIDVANNVNTGWDIDTEIEIPEDEFDITSAKTLYDEVKDETAEDLYEWYSNNIE